MHDEVLIKGKSETQFPIHRDIKPGMVYKHFKGNLYRVLHIARHTETGESLVVYQSLGSPQQIWCRPYGMFASKVDRDKYPNIDPAIEYRFTEEPNITVGDNDKEE